MKKAVLKYDLDNPYDLMEFNRAMKATDLALAIFRIKEHLHELIEVEESKDETPESARLIVGLEEQLSIDLDEILE